MRNTLPEQINPKPFSCLFFVSILARKAHICSYYLLSTTLFRSPQPLIAPVLQRSRSDLDTKDKSPGYCNNMELRPRGTKRARMPTESPKSKSPKLQSPKSESPKPEASASQSAPVLAEPPALLAPPPQPDFHVSPSEDTKWGHRPRSQKEDCNKKCCHGLIFNWACMGLTTHTLPATFKKIKKDVLHIMDYTWVKEAFAKQRMQPQPYMIL
jgi:hypothetical protein